LASGNWHLIVDREEDEAQWCLGGNGNGFRQKPTEIERTGAAFGFTRPTLSRHRLMMAAEEAHALLHL
jgi:hypothetical protein